MKEIAIVGNGAWGKALFHVLSQNASVTLHKRHEYITEEIVVIAVPTQSLREISPYLPPDSKGITLINTAKGLEQRTHALPMQIIRKSHPLAHYYSLIGPSFAEEVKQDMPTVINLGYEGKKTHARSIRDVLQTPLLRVRLSKGCTELELAGALKNVYAIGCGIAAGLGYQTNTRIQLILVAIEEMRVLFERMGIKMSPQSMPGTIGDLILTCNSRESRNFRFGENLATLHVTDSLQKVGSTVEGYTTLESVSYLEAHAEVDLPLAHFIKRAVEENNPAKIRTRFAEFIYET